MPKMKKPTRAERRDAATADRMRSIRAWRREHAAPSPEAVAKAIADALVLLVRDQDVIDTKSISIAKIFKRAISILISRGFDEDESKAALNRRIVGLRHVRDLNW